MDQADQELRETITHIWPLQAKKILDLLVPRSEELNAGKLTVGKIYAGFLILESWRNTKFGQMEGGDAPVSDHYLSLDSIIIISYDFNVIISESKVRSLINIFMIYLFVCCGAYQLNLAPNS